MKRTMISVVLAWTCCVATTAWAKSSFRHRHAAANTTQTRIVGGTTVTSASKYPFIVQWYGCDGVLIHPDIVLTAAHCNAIDSGYSKVVVGNINYVKWGNYPSGSGTLIDIAARVVHPYFNSKTMVNDYLILKLANSATQTPIQLNSDPNYPASGQDLTVIGFGVTSNGGSSLSNTLQEVTVNAVSQQSCSLSYPNQIDATTMICAGVPNGGKDSCQGDSGGPIFDSNNMLVGIVSWGYQCALQGYPGIYSRVSGGYSWINQQICALSSNPPSWCSPPVVSPPTLAPVVPPTLAPVVPPTLAPVIPPTLAPVIPPTLAPTAPPSLAPVVPPTRAPVLPPTLAPVLPPTLSPIVPPSVIAPVVAPTPLVVPPSQAPVVPPTLAPIVPPTRAPVIVPPTVAPFRHHHRPNIPPVQRITTCVDSSAIFNVDSVTGNQNCAWLSINLSRYGYLCIFLDVGRACPATCNFCGVFAR